MPLLKNEGHSYFLHSFSNDEKVILYFKVE
jgi:hypothetical protein